ncbi:Hypothetical protein LUCI_0812 [Lucifera butyrica]|uniref:Uncharacterized protein n=1 Tax=Lucifera butyrica TaxID=1351585 RepID=A0A498R5T7_9FIRM|nr:hypothetical protein [Lucifera butyrica]VBB05602.1 Hypothetical protein LUCI_0812 [Lucifera butyrica]
MNVITMKSFRILHKKMMISVEYRSGYQLGIGIRELFERLSIERLQSLRRTYLCLHTQFAAGLAMVCLEVIYEKFRGRGAAA